MLDVHGVGVLIQGVDGIGKSETALELIKRGHLLVSGEETRIFQREPGFLVAESTEVMEKLLEVKDIGKVNVVNLFGIGVHRPRKNLMMVVELVRPSECIDKNHSTVTFFDTTVPCIKIYVEPGRNIASLIETAALNHQLVTNGVSAEKEYEYRLQINALEK